LRHKQSNPEALKRLINFSNQPDLAILTCHMTNLEHTYTKSALKVSLFGLLAGINRNVLPAMVGWKVYSKQSLRDLFIIKFGGE
jgi:hypothetical protein